MLKICLVLWLTLPSPAGYRLVVFGSKWYMGFAIARMLTQCIWSPRKTLCAWTPGTYTNARADRVKGHQNHRPVVLERLPGTEHPHPTQYVRQAQNLCFQCINVTYVFSQCLYWKALCSLPCLCWHSCVCHAACSLHLWLNMIQQSRTNWT